MAFLKKRDHNVKGSGAFVAEECELTRAFPALDEFLSSPVWPGSDEPRTLGTAMLLCDPPSWKVWLHDRDGECSCFVSGSTLTGALRACEAILRDGGGDWRPDRKQGKAKRS